MLWQGCSLSPRELERKAPRSVWATELPASRPIRWIVRESREAHRTDSPAFYRTNFAHIRNPLARIPSRSLVHGHLPAPLRVHWTNFARFRPHSESPRPLSIGWTRIRKPDAASTISQPRYGRNQPPRNHIPTSTTPRPRSNRPCPVLSAIHLSVQPLLNHKKSAAKLPRYYCAIRIAAHLIITDFILCIPMCRQCHSAGLTTIKTSHLARQLLRTNDSSPASSLSSSRTLSTSTLIALALSADESA